MSAALHGAAVCSDVKCEECGQLVLPAGAFNAIGSVRWSKPCYIFLLLPGRWLLVWVGNVLRSGLSARVTDTRWLSANTRFR